MGIFVIILNNNRELPEAAFLRRFQQDDMALSLVFFWRERNPTRLEAKRKIANYERVNTELLARDDLYFFPPRCKMYFSCIIFCLDFFHEL